MRKKLFILKILILTLLSNVSIYSQYNFQWLSIYNHPYYGNGYYDEAIDVVGDEDGNIYVTGTSFGIGDDSRYDITTIKYNSVGDSLWVKRYNFQPTLNSTEEAVKIGLDNFNNVYVAGYGVEPGVASTSMILIKYNTFGDELWVKRFHDTTYDYRNDVSDMIVENNGDVYLGGYSSGRYINSGSSAQLLKYNSDGVLQWKTSYRRNERDYNGINSILKTNENIYAVGATLDSTYGQIDYLVIKYDLNGNLIWAKRNDFGFNSIAYSVQADKFGNIYVAGYVRSNGNYFDLRLIKYNSSGEVLWIKNYLGRYDLNSSFPYPKPHMLNIDDIGNVYVNFMTFRIGYRNDIALAKYDSSGNQLWLNIYNSGLANSYEEATDFKIDNDHNIYVSGISKANYSINSFVILKYDQKGILKKEIRNNNQFDKVFSPASFFIFDNKDLIVTGTSLQTNSSFITDYCTIKYSYSVGISQTSSTIPSSFSLSQNYPNPFNPTTNIRFQIPESGFVTLKVFDITGREVATLVNEQMNSGEYNYQFSPGMSGQATDGYQLGSGVYFYRLTVNDKNGKMNFSETKKMVVVR